METKVRKTDKEWKSILNKTQYDILRKRGTERPFTGKYWNNHEKGIYHCAGCGQALFKSEHKYDSGCGWPSYDRPFNPEAVIEKDDRSHGMNRTEILCSNCLGHLGHVFNDGPLNTTGNRFCINSGALEFKPSKS